MCCILWGIVAVGSIYNGHVSMGSNQLGNPFVFYPTAICGVAAMLIMAILLGSSKYNKKPPLSFVKWFGRNSYYAMAVHNPIKGVIIILVTTIFSKLGVHIIGQNNYVVAIVSFIITTILVVVFIVGVNWLFKRNLTKTRNE